MAYFTGIGFVAPALAVVLSTEEVALFATAYKFAFRTVSLVVAPFHGVYRPLFARVRAPLPAALVPANKKRIRDIPGYTEICRDIVGCAPGVSAQ